MSTALRHAPAQATLGQPLQRQDRVRYLLGNNLPPANSGWPGTEHNGGGDRTADTLFAAIQPPGWAKAWAMDMDAVRIALPRDDAQFAQALKDGYTVKWGEGADAQEFTISLAALRDNLDVFNAATKAAYDTGQLTPDQKKRCDKLVGKINRGLDSLGLGGDFKAPAGGRAAINAAALAIFAVSAAIPLYVSSQEARYRPIMYAAYAKSFLQVVRMEFDKSTHWGTISMNWRQRHMVNVLATVLFVVPLLKPKELGHLAQDPGLIGVSSALTLLGFVVRADSTALPKAWEVAKKLLTQLGKAKGPDAPAVPDDVLQASVLLKLSRYALSKLRDDLTAKERGGALSPNQNTNVSEILRYVDRLLAEIAEPLKKDLAATTPRPQSTMQLSLRKKLQDNLQENIYGKEKAAVTLLGFLILSAATVMQALPGQGDGAAHAAPNGTLANPAGFSDMLADDVGVTAGNVWMSLQSAYNKEDLADAFRNFIGLSLLSIPLLAPDLSSRYLSNLARALPAMVGFAVANMLAPGVLGKAGTIAILALLDKAFPSRAAAVGADAATAATALDDLDPQGKKVARAPVPDDATEARTTVHAESPGVAADAAVSLANLTNQALDHRFTADEAQASSAMDDLAVGVVKLLAQIAPAQEDAGPPRG